jgi:O-succinylbenzoic acid--CoA ligase
MLPFLHHPAQTKPNHPALILGERTLTFRELWYESVSMAAAWKERGIGLGDRVAILLPTSVEYVVCIHAANIVGATLVLLNTRLTGAELDYQLELTECRHLIYSAETEALHQQLTAPHTANLVSELKSDTPLRNQGDVANNTPLSIVERGGGEVALAIVFTSGTSGKPKAALLTVGAFYASALASTERIGKRDDDRWLCVLPLYHVGGLSIILRATIDEASVELMPKFDAPSLNAKLHDAPITLLSVVPTMLYRMIETRLPHQTPKALRLILLGGAAPSSELLQRAAALNLPIATTYGMTETASQVATALPDLPTRKLGTVGKPLQGNQIRIVDVDGNDLPHGEHGEVIISGQTLMREYVNNPEATAKALRDGWLYTGDIGYLDADGDLFVLQRRSDLIISGGENVYPAEVEAVLLSHPLVAQALVVGVPDEEWGQLVGALVVADGTISEAELLAFCADKLARYKQPRRLRFVSELPLTASGKPKRDEAVQWLQDL